MFSITLRKMKFIKISLAVVTVIAAIFLLRQMSTDSDEASTNKSPEHSKSPEHLSIKNRNSVPQELVLINDFEVVGKIIRMYKNKDRIWLSDAGANTVLEYKENGDLVRSFGKSGGAMWENGSIWYFSKHIDSYYMYDFSKNIIRRHNLETDSVEFYFKGSASIGNTVDIAQNQFILLNSTNDDFSFIHKDISTEEVIKEWSIKKTIIDEFNTFPKENLRLIFEGQFRRNKRGDVAYICYKFSCFFIINSSGQLSLGRTIDGFDIPKSSNKDIGGGYVLNGIEPDNHVNYASAMDNDYLYILSNVVFPKNSDSRILDLYSLDTNKYEKSILLPNFEEQRPISIAIYDKKLTILYENYTVATYETSF